MGSNIWVSGVALVILLLLPFASAGNGNGNNGNGNGNGGPRPTPGLDAAVLTGLGSIGYVAYQLVQARKK